MSDEHPNYAPDDQAAIECYRRALRTLHAADIDFLVGGAYALARYTGVVRHTKDFDLFLRPRDRDRALAALAGVGFRTEITYSHWLAKAFQPPYFIDLIYNMGNGSGSVDDAWFAHAVPGEVLGERVLLCPAEEVLWSKAFIMERNRYDGADIAHLLRTQAERMDWHRLLIRFGAHWRVLYGHLVLFGFIYPAERDRVPTWILRALHERLGAELEMPPPAGRDAMLTLLHALGREHGKSLVLSTHLLGDVERVCDSVVILHQGRVLRHGSVEELRTRRHDRYRLQIQGDPTRFLEELRLEGARVIHDNGRGELRVAVPPGWTTRAFFALADNRGVALRGLQRDDEDLEELFYRVIGEHREGNTQ